MISKNEVKYIQSLCHKKNRQQEGLFLVEGEKIVDELLQGAFAIQRIYAVQEWIDKHPGLSVAATAVTEAELQKISALQTPNQVLAIVQQPEQKVTDLHGLNLILDGIQDPGNLGTIIRIADWFGIPNIICSNDTVEVYNPKVIQSTMGSFMRVKLVYEDLPAFLKTHPQQVYGALLNGEPMHTVQKPVQGFLVIGNESKGIRAEVLPFITHPVTIPRIGHAESLNAAVATGILLSHLT